MRGNGISSRIPRWVPIAAGAVVVALVIAVAIVVHGFDDWKITPKADSIWVVNTQSKQFAQINTESKELTTPTDPQDDSATSIAQWGEAAVRLTKQKSLVALSQANPQASAKVPTTNGLVHAGQFVLTQSQSQQLQAGNVGATSLSEIPALPKVASIKSYTIDDAGDVVFLAGKKVYRSTFSGTSWDTPSEIGQVSGVNTAQAKVVSFGSNWAVMDDTNLVVNGKVAQRVAAGAVLPISSSTAQSLIIASPTGAITYGTDGKRDGQYKVSGSNATAAAIWENGTAHLAWLSKNSAEGGSAQFANFSDSKFTGVNADSAGSTGQDVVAPEFSTNGVTTVLNDTYNGRVWQLLGSKWELIASSLNWSPSKDQQHQQSTNDPIENTNPSCPVAATGDDAEFGVRKGQSALLPVLLGATDETRDDSLSILSGAQGPEVSRADGVTVRVVANNQKLAIDVPKDATNFEIKYQITDGNCGKTVTGTAKVTVADDTKNEPPEYVPNKSDADDTLTASKTSSVSIDALERWKDPEGDQLYIADAELEQANNDVAVTASGDGKIALKLNDVSANSLKVKYTVSDGSASATHTQTIKVADNSEITTQPVAVVANVAQAKQQLSLASAFPGGSAGISISDIEAVSQDDAPAVQAGSGTSIVVPAGAKAGNDYIYTYTAKRAGSRDATKQHFRLVVVDGKQKLSLSPVTVFVQDQQDALVDGLSTAYSEDNSPMWITDVTAGNIDQGGLATKLVGGDKIKVTATKAEPGKVGTFRFTVSDGEHEATTTATVIGVKTPTADPLAVDDSVTIQQGAQLDLDVLANDIAPLGTQLQLDPRVREDQTTSKFVSHGGLAFPATSSLRILAPKTPGSYDIQYAAYITGYPDLVGQGTVHVTVVKSTTDSDITAPTLTGTVAEGTATILTLPTTQLDANGGAVKITKVAQPSHGSATITSDGRGVKVVAATGGKLTGSFDLNYTLSSVRGEGSDTGKIVLGTRTVADTAPITFTDYVYIAAGKTTSIDPTLNDLAVAADDEITLVSAQRLSDSDQAKGDDTIKPDTQADATDRNTIDVGLVDGQETKYSYTVKSGSATATGATSQGTIIVRPITQGNSTIAQYPVVSDTTVGPDQISSGNKFSIDMSHSVAYAGELTMTTPAGLGGNKAVAAHNSTNSKVVSGELTNSPTTAVVKWQATGDDSDVVSYGLLSVPAKNGLTPELKEPKHVLTVARGKTSRTDKLENYFTEKTWKLGVKTGGSKATVQRQGATCTVGTNSITYTTGSNQTVADDTCTFRARLADSAQWATLSIPVKIEFDQQPPVLSGGSLETVKPDAKATKVHLKSAAYLSNPDKVGGVKFSSAGSSANGVKITVSDNGLVTIVAQKTARQGTVVPVDVAVNSWDGPGSSPQTPVRFTVTVGDDGIKKLDVHKISLTCNVGGDTCASDLASENNSILHQGNLSIVGTPTSGKAGAPKSEVQGTRAIFAIGSEGVGGTYKYSYTMQDQAQPVSNYGSETIELTVNAKPNKPESTGIETTESSVTFSVRVDQAFPKITEIKIPGGKCTSSDNSSGVTAACTVSGLDPTKPNESYNITAVNAAGASAPLTVTGGAFKAATAASIDNWSVAADSSTASVSFTVPSGLEWRWTDSDGNGNDWSTSITRTIQVGTSGSSTKKVYVLTRPAKADQNGNREAVETSEVIWGAPAPDISLGDGEFDGRDYEVTVINSMDSGNVDVQYGYKINNGECNWQSSADLSIDLSASKYDNTEVSIAGCARIAGGGHVKGTGDTKTTNDRTVVPFSVPNDLELKYKVSTNANGDGVYAASWVSTNLSSGGKEFKVYPSDDLLTNGYSYGPLDSSAEMEIALKGHEGARGTGRVKISGQNSRYPVKVDDSDLTCTASDSDDSDDDAEVDTGSVSVIGASASDYTVSKDSSNPKRAVVKFHGDLAGLSDFPTEECE